MAMGGRWRGAIGGARGALLAVAALACSFDPSGRPGPGGTARDAAPPGAADAAPPPGAIDAAPPPGAIDAAPPDAAPPTACELGCTEGTCVGPVCVIACDEPASCAVAVVCPAGLPC